jgi:hypothetical protein
MHETTTKQKLRITVAAAIALVMVGWLVALAIATLSAR